LRLYENCLDDARPVADHGKRDLAGGPDVGYPPANGDGLSNVLGKIDNARRGVGHVVRAAAEV